MKTILILFLFTLVFCSEEEQKVGGYERFSIYEKEEKLKSEIDKAFVEAYREALLYHNRYSYPLHL